MNKIKGVATNSFDIIDGEKVLLKVPSPVNPTEYFAAIYVWQKRFVTELREKYNLMWEEEKEFPV
ncbi:MAG: hypothetical protein ACFFE6_11760 [Candidatus Thorarchaeota archaeon]